MTKYWRHKVKECDNWYEPTTQWHLDWQDNFPKENQEVNLLDIETGIKHRADICLNNGLVIEIQNSPIRIDEIIQRENFYGKNKMIWIINGDSLAKHSVITYRYNRKQFSLKFFLPVEDNRLYKQYSIDEIKTHLYESLTFSEILNDKDLVKFREKLYYFEFFFEKPKDFKQLSLDIECDFKSICYKLYGVEFYKSIFRDFHVTYTNLKRDSYADINLTKKYWREFIEFMKFPIFIDKLPGLENHLLFWYQENKIVKKENFINKYIQYTKNVL